MVDHIKSKAFPLHKMGLFIVALLILVLFIAPSFASAQKMNIQRNANCGGNISLGSDGGSGTPAGCDKPDKGKSGDETSTGKIENLIKTIINVFSAVVGAICVIMIIIGGFRYVTSGGSSESISGAKNTILYAIVGLIIVAFAQIIVQFVLQRI